MSTGSGSRSATGLSATSTWPTSSGARCSSRSVTLLVQQGQRGSRAGHAGVAQRCRPRSGGASRRGATGTTGELTRLDTAGSRGLLVDPAAQRIARHAECASDADNGNGARAQQLVGSCATELQFSFQVANGEQHRSACRCRRDLDRCGRGRLDHVRWRGGRSSSASCIRVSVGSRVCLEATPSHRKPTGDSPAARGAWCADRRHPATRPQ